MKDTFESDGSHVMLCSELVKLEPSSAYTELNQGQFSLPSSNF